LTRAIVGLLSPAGDFERTLGARLEVWGVPDRPVDDVALGNGELHVAGDLKEVVGERWIVDDGEFLRRLVRLVLIDEDGPFQLQPHQVGDPQVDLSLPTVAGERSLDAAPEAFDVDNRLATLGLLGVLADQVRLLDPDRAETNGLDLDQGADVEDGAVGVAVDEVALLSVHRDFQVLHGSWSVAIGTVHDRGAHDGPAADDAAPAAIEATHLAEPVLPLGVSDVAFLEDAGDAVEQHLFVLGLHAGNAVVAGAWAPVGLGHLRRMQAVGTPSVVGGGLADGVGLDVTEEDGLVLTNLCSGLQPAGEFALGRPGLNWRPFDRSHA
jgi:hypothetical protein